MNLKRMLILLIAAAFSFGAFPAQAYWWAIDHKFVEKHVTERLTDIYPGSRGINDDLGTASWHMGAYKDAMYFWADDGVHGAELWRYDGENASLVQDIQPGAQGSFPTGFVTYKGDMYFTAVSGDRSPLFRFDGETLSEAAELGGFGLVVANGHLYFRRDDADHGQELWRYDGVTAALVADINLGSGDGVGSCCARFGDEVIFAGRTQDGEGWEPWSFDGTTLKSLGAINPGGDSEFYVEQRKHSAVYQGAFYFRANDGAHGREVWRYDGDSIAMVEDFAPGTASSNPSNFEVFNNALYFSANGLLGNTIHHFKGDEIEVTGIFGYPTRLYAFNNRLYFSGDMGAFNIELFAYDGVSETLVKEINLTTQNGSPYSSFPRAFTAPPLTVTAGPVGGASSAKPTKLGSYLYFMATDGVHGFELWRTGRQRKLVIDTAVAAEILDKFWTWPGDQTEALRRDVVVATFMSEGNRRRLLQRRETNIGALLRDRRDSRSEVSIADTSRSIAITSVVFDVKTGEILAAGTDIARSVDEKDAATMRRRGQSFITGLTLKQAMDMPVQAERQTLERKPR